jgi:pimeloyl-ACP methyl ester carboxylesterase
VKVIVNNLMTEYGDCGKGRIVLFLHGWGSNAKSFDEVIRSLAPHFRIIALNLPGFGGSDTPKTAWSVQDYTDFTTDFIAKLKLNNIYAIIGHSFGGRIMLKGLSNKQLDAKKLVFLDTAGVKQRRTLRLLMFAIAAKIGKVTFALPGLKNFAAPLKNRLYSAAGSKDYANAGSEVMKETFKRVVAEDLSSNIIKFEQPALAIWGADDEMTPVDDLAEYRKNPHVEIHILENAGHYVFLDKPTETIKLIKDFLC